MCIYTYIFKIVFVHSYGSLPKRITYHHGFYVRQQPQPDHQVQDDSEKQQVRNFTDVFLMTKSDTVKIQHAQPQSSFAVS